MIGSVTSEYISYSVFIGAARPDSTDSAFDRTLAEAAENYLMKNAPDKWVTEPGLSFNAVNAALDFKKNELGINDTEPTHELTAEQKEWLNSRHDFSTMKTYVRYSYEYGGTTQYGAKATAEYSNFLADLAYLGVCAPEDFIQLSPIDTRPGGNSTLTEYVNDVWDSDHSLRNTAQMFVKHLENMFSFYNERSKDPARAAEGDAELAALIRERYMPLHRRFFELIDELIGGGSENQLPQNSAVPAIEDASGRLKEDFGGSR